MHVTLALTVEGTSEQNCYGTIISVGGYPGLDVILVLTVEGTPSTTVIEPPSLLEFTLVRSLYW